MAKLPEGLKISMGKRNPQENTVNATVTASVPKILTRRKLEHWLDKQQASLIGKAFDTKVKERDKFIDWFMGIYEEASHEEP